MKNFQTAINPNNFPVNTYQKVIFGNQKILIFHAKEGFFATEATCTHKQCDLSTGDFSNHSLICPCHGAKFDITDGKALSLPATTALKIYPVRINKGYLNIELDS